MQFTYLLIDCYKDDTYSDCYKDDIYLPTIRSKYGRNKDSQTRKVIKHTHTKRYYFYSRDWKNPMGKT